MSDLQLALIALGVVIIGGVVAFNWWQERRFAQESLRRFEGPADDALMQDFHIEPVSVEASITVEELFDDVEQLERRAEERTEPVLRDEPPLVEEADPEPAPEAPIADEPPSAPEPQPAVAEPPPQETAAPQPAAAAAQPLRSAASVQDAGLDERVDLIAVLQAEGGFAAPAVRRLLQAMPGFDKPLNCSGLDSQGEWLPVAASGDDIQFAQLACALQLADRAGPVSPATLNAFESEMENLAAGLGASLDWQGAADPLGYAAELDNFCVAVDVMVGFHIMHGANGPIAGTKLRGLAEAQGMQLRDDGAFHYTDDAGNTLFKLVSEDQRPFRPETLRTVFYRGVSFQLDVPRVSRCTDAFNQMVLLARQLQIGLDGTLVDDNQRRLGDAEIGKIRQQLDLLNERMLERGIVPGSPTALRLFA